MSIWAIGDIQGCHASLVALLSKIGFEDGKDTVWFCGDMIGRGPESGKVLELISSIENKQVVLGNWELYYLLLANKKLVGNDADNLAELVNCDDCMKWCDWLRSWPLFYWSEKMQWAVVHAGIDWQWTLSDCMKYSEIASDILQSDTYASILYRCYKTSDDKWRDEYVDERLWSMVFNIFTRIRMYNKDLGIEFDYSGVEENDLGQVSWFNADGRKTEAQNIVFGHWSRLVNKVCGNVYNIDYGCVYGGSLAALRIDGDSREICLV